ncbi:MAG: cytochrome P450, partial [Halobacteria archaeon]|nr:cytochrome P450 [Halobacteria archaeon]
GDVVSFRIGRSQTYMITNPGDIKKVLVKDDHKFVKPEFQDYALSELLGNGLVLSEDEFWRSQRRLMQPAFSMEKIAEYSDTMADYTERMAAGWDPGEIRDVHSEMARLTVRIIVRSMFGTELGDERTEKVQEALEPIGQRFEPDIRRFLLPDWVRTQEDVNYDRCVSTLDRILDEIVDARRESKEERTDLLSMLLKAQSEGRLNSRQVRDELMTILLAGHDTTALALTYTWYLLSQHPGIEERLLDELSGVLDGETPTFKDLHELEYTERVLKEAMRLYPPVYAMFREARFGIKLGGYRIERGSVIMLPQWVVHRDSRYYENPESFDPDRWAPERENERPRYSYFPFGAGPRHCIGKQFAMVEAKIILATIAQKYRLELVSDGPLDLRGSITMHPRNPVNMKVRDRRE